MLHPRYMACRLTLCGIKRKISCNVRQRQRRPTLEALRRARVDAGLTISELAKRAGVSRDTISHAERGRHSLQGTTLSKIAHALGRVPSELLAEEERLAPKVESRSSLEPSLNDVLEEERRAAWEAAVEQARRLREIGWAQMWRALSEWRASKGRGEPYTTRRNYLDEMGNLLQEVYDADVELGRAYLEAALRTKGGSEASGPRYLQEQSRKTGHFYGELLGLVKSARLSVLTGEDAAAAKRATADEAAAEHAQSETRPLSVEEPDAA
jgi:transcriptional regulator with XRE-family HTH domain